MNKQTKVWLVLSIALSLLALGSACGGAEGYRHQCEPTADAASNGLQWPDRHNQLE